MNIEIKNRFTNEVMLSGEYESIEDCLEKNRGVDLRDVDLRGTCLRGACLEDAYLRGAKNHSESHDFFQEIVRHQPIKTFTDKELACIGQIVIHKLCWETIRKRFGKTAEKVFEKLSKIGFDEWEKRYKEVLRL